MNLEREVTIHIEETARGTYRAQVAAAPPDRFATGEDPMIAVRGALAVARDAVDEAAEYDRPTGSGVAGHE